MNSSDVQTMELIEEDVMDATDDEDESSHDDGSNYDETPNLMDVAMENEVTAQLVAAGKNCFIFFFFKLNFHNCNLIVFPLSIFVI